MNKSPHQALMLAATCLAAAFVAGCSLPPREAWKIVRRDGLILYWMREYNPIVPQSRYMSGAPLVTRRTPSHAPAARVPYRPAESSSRYLSGSPVPARRKPEAKARPDTSAALIAAPSLPTPAEAVVSPGPAKPRPTPAKESPAMDALPYGAPVPGRPGMVNSPFAGKEQLVDVTGMAVGDPVKCPYSGKLFRVPPMMQAAAPAREEAPEEAGAEP